MNAILLLIILIPVIEIYLFIEIGGKIGALYTISLIFVTAFLGVFYARYEGLNTLKSGVSQLYRNQMPLFELMSGAALAVAAFLLIFPGFATDLLGFLIIFPVTRKIIFNLLTKNKKMKIKEKNRIIIKNKNKSCALNVSCASPRHSPSRGCTLFTL